jgi:hypothetical protein
MHSEWQATEARVILPYPREYLQDRKRWTGGMRPTESDGRAPHPINHRVTVVLPLLNAFPGWNEHFFEEYV